MQTQENLKKLYINIDSETCLSLIGFEYSQELYSLVAKSRASLRKWLPWVDYIHSQGDFSQLIQYYLNKHRNNGTITMCIKHKNQAAGIIGFNYIDWKNKSGALGYWLGNQFRGKGIMLSSCREMIQHGFRHLHLHKINILCATGNLSSRKIPERLNFRKEGLLRDGEWLNDHYEDLYSYSMLAKEWA
ncbi:MAG: GNAT family N-acetyltransferase [Oligoflexales bacterium]|nr:GNAT family N-acetyltransferase [Oligoflexales bacterium]